MSMQDPIADMLTRIRNAQLVQEKSVSMPASRLKASILNVLKSEGYIQDFHSSETDGKGTLQVELKYYLGKGVIEKIKRISKPGIRVYKKSHEMPSILGGMGVAVVSTSKGVMTEKSARSQKLGGEILCTVE
jgi:small subunit ribosomal protein S8